MRVKSLSRLKIFTWKRLVSDKGITLLELLISILVVSIMVLSFYSLEEYAHSQVIFSDRRAKVQNDLNYALEHMSKYVHQANGYVNDPGIVLTGSGFQVRVDRNSPQTPSDTTDDDLISYSLSSNTLSTSCTGTCDSFTGEDLSSRIISGFASDTVMPDPMPDQPASGFFVKIDPDGNGMTHVVEVALVGRYNPSGPTTTAARLTTNPQVGMKTRLICNGCSAN